MTEKHPMQGLIEEAKKPLYRRIDKLEKDLRKALKTIDRLEGANEALIDLIIRLKEGPIQVDKTKTQILKDFATMTGYPVVDLSLKEGDQE